MFRKPYKNEPFGCIYLFTVQAISIDIWRQQVLRMMPIMTLETMAAGQKSETFGDTFTEKECRENNRAFHACRLV